MVKNRGWGGGGVEGRRVGGWRWVHSRKWFPSVPHCPPLLRQEKWGGSMLKEGRPHLLLQVAICLGWGLRISPFACLNWRWWQGVCAQRSRWSQAASPGSILEGCPLAKEARSSQPSCVVGTGLSWEVPEVALPSRTSQIGARVTPSSPPLLVPAGWRTLKLTEVQFSSVARVCLTLWDPMDYSTPGFPVHHQLMALAQTHVYWVGDAIQSSHPLLSTSPPEVGWHRTRSWEGGCLFFNGLKVTRE